MMSIEELERSILAGAREELGPSATDRMRVQSGLVLTEAWWKPAPLRYSLRRSLMRGGAQSWRGGVAIGLVIGGTMGLAVGLLLGANPFLAKAFERFLYYLGPTPKIVFFPVMIMWFGVGPESKIAMGTMSCFFPIVLSAAAGMRQIESVLIRVRRSFRLNTWQMVSKIYLPAMREPIVNGVRLGMGVAMIGTLLAETKLSNKGIGFMIIDAYNTFDMPRMYAVLAVLFVIAIGVNTLVGRASRQ